MDVSKKRAAAEKSSRGRKPGKVAKKERKVKDGPKKPTSAYMYFAAHLREEMKKQGKDTSVVANVAKICGESWRKLTDKDKAPFVEKASADKARYEKEKGESGKAQGKDPNKPKKPQSAYFFFLADFRKTQEGKELAGGEVMTLAGKKWQAMSAQEKKPFNELSEKDKKRYQADMEHYVKSGGSASAPTSKPKSAKSKPTVDDDDEEEDDDDDVEDDEDEDEDDDDDDEDDDM